MTVSRFLTLQHLIFVVGLVLLTLATMCYAVVIFGTVRGSGRPVGLPVAFVLTGALWLVVGTVLETWLGALSVPAEPILLAAEEPALEAVVEGFLVLTALGVSLQTLPGFFGLPAPGARLFPATNLAYQIGLVGLVGGGLLTGDLNLPDVGRPIAALGSLALMGVVVTYVVAIRLFEPSRQSVVDSGNGLGWARAVRLAYVWLLLGLAIQAEESTRAALQGTFIPLVALGAARHALALGFVTLLIVGMASRVLPVFTGRPLWRTWLVDVATAGLVGGALLRVPVELIAPYGTSPIGSVLLAISGPLALVGLVAFALNFVGMVTRRS